MCRLHYVSSMLVVVIRDRGMAAILILHCGEVSQHNILHHRVVGKIIKRIKIRKEGKT